MKKFLLALISLWLLAGCELMDNPVPDNSPHLRALSHTEQTIVASSGQFAFNLWNQIGGTEADNNYFISPLSVDYALAMTCNGAGGNTKTAIRHGLALDSLSDEELNSSFKSLTGFLLSLDKKTEIIIGNSVWYREDLHVKNDFSQLISNYYDGKAAGLNFQDPAAKNTINQWVEDATKGKITNLIDKIPDDAVMYLINAIYFKSLWTYKFDKESTVKADFHLDDGEVIQAEMMKSKGVKLQFYSDGDILFIDIPYGNGQFAMSVMMPEQTGSIGNLGLTLTAGKYQNWLNRADSLSTELTLPKFNIEYKTDLKDALTGMGMGIAFSDTADFSKLFDEALSLKISRVLHKAKIEVDEEGTTAAAATAVEIVMTTAGPAKPPLITIDRPFLFIIHERYSNTILFCGQLMNPSI